MALEPQVAENSGTDSSIDRGYFTSNGRAAAIAASLPLISSYFVSGRDKHRLEVSPIRLGSEPGADPRVAAIAALRLRAALVAAARLADIVEGVLNRPAFRYVITRKESAGVLAGQLDTARWISRRHAITSPPSYPILRVERSHVTAENRLAFGAVSILSEELEQALQDVSPPRGSLEAQDAENVLERLGRIARMPPFSPLQHLRNRRNGDPQALLELAGEVERRIDSGRVANPDSYKKLAGWVRVPREAGMVSGGDIDWSFYGTTFDTVLFEFWCMQTLADSLSLVLGDPSQVADLRKGSTTKSFVWYTDSAVVRLHFQRSLRASTAHGNIVWKDPDGVGLGGQPDLTFSISRRSTSEVVRYLYMDPKLRQREGIPTEEIYKLLGYFLNSGYGAAGKGAILTYAPGPALSPSVRTLRTDDGGTALAAALDPDRPHLNEPVFDELVGLVLDEVLEIDRTE